MTTIALLLAALAAAPQPRPLAPAAVSALVELAPAPGRWEVEDAPAYFSDRTAIKDAPAPRSAPHEPVADGDSALPAEPREGEALVARRRP